MKRIFVVLLAICLFTGGAIPAFAADIGDKFIDDTLIVSTLEELQTALDIAKNGDNIVIASTIN